MDTPKNDFEPKEIQDNPDLTNYVRMLHEDMTLTQSNLKEKSLTVSTIRAKWLNYYFLEKNNLKRIRTKKEEILKEKSGLGQSVLKMKSDDRISAIDPRIKTLDELSERVKSNMDFLERAMNILNDFPFAIKNSIDIIKLERL